MDTKDLPQHIAIIMDGNGRWARQRNLMRTQGHLEGVKRAEDIIQAAQEVGIKVLTLFAFSTENWKRPRDEVSMLMKTFISVINQKMKDFDRVNVRFHFIGRRNEIPNEVLECLDKAMTLTEKNTGMVLNLALNYGGRLEILEATRRIAKDVKEGKIDVEDITEETFSGYLYTRGLPDPDLLIRTSGERRLSNFLLWQLSYAELYFTEKYWPEFTKEEFFKALEDYKHRERRYGKIGKDKYVPSESH